MAPRAFWTGYLKLSLVTCRVAMTPATTEAEKVRFHTLNRTTGNRVVSRYVDDASGRPVDDEDVARGYQTGEDSTVVIEDEDLEAIALESTRTIDIERFVPRGDIGWVYLDRPHYLVPDDKVGAEAFAVIRAAMAESEMAALSRLVLYRRERGVMIEPRGRGLVLWTLRFGDEVRQFDGAPEPAHAPDKTALTLVKKLIAERTRPFSPDMLEDPVQADLLDLIAARQKKRPARKPKAAARHEAPSNVVSIMDALKRSLASAKSPRSK